MHDKPTPNRPDLLTCSHCKRVWADNLAQRAQEKIEGYRSDGDQRVKLVRVTCPHCGQSTVFDVIPPTG